MNHYILYQGDCIKVLPSLNEEEVDFVLTDPPYNVGKDYGPQYNDSKEKQEYLDWCTIWLDELCLLSSCVMFTPGTTNLNDWVQMKPPTAILIRIVLNAMSRNSIGSFNQWEPVLVYGKPNKKSHRDVYYGPMTQQKGVGNHPVPKSLKFISEIIKDYTNEGDVVLDPFLGSGTTMFACQNLRRSCVGIEINQGFCNHVKQRCFGRMFLDREVTYGFHSSFQTANKEVNV